MGTYLDTLAALVPAEALALYAGFVIPYTTKTTSVHGTNVTVVSDPGLLQWSCAGLLALSRASLFLVGRQQVLFSPLDVLRFFISPMAFAGWMLVQNPGVWDSWWPGSSVGERTVIAAVAAILLGVAANLLGQQADATAGTLAVTGVSPDNGSTAGGARVTLTGNGFTGATDVKFGHASAQHLIVTSDTELTVTSPQAADPGPVDVTVTTPAGTSPTSAADHFTYGFTYAAAAATPTGPGISPQTRPGVAQTRPGVSPETGPVADEAHVTPTGSAVGTGHRSGIRPAQRRQLTVITWRRPVQRRPIRRRPIRRRAGRAGG